jgi:2-polyprenyl-6-methoxyphenol hydroxylase-like FAD-dependent oxidoreductase
MWDVRSRASEGAQEESTSTTIETDVVIVGAGPAGLASALFLSEYGVKNMVLEMFPWTAHVPRAHITNQRTMEIMRDAGLEEEVKEKGVPQELMGDTVFCASLAGEELARLHTWGTHPRRKADYDLASPSRHCDIPQTLLEPIILGGAARRGSRIRFNTEYLSFEQAVPDPGEVPHRRRRRPQQGRRATRPSHGRRDGLRGQHEHHLQGRPQSLRRPPA